MTSRQRDSHTEDYSPKSIPAFNTAQERARYLVFAESTAEKMNSMLASHVFKMDNSYFKEAEPSIDKEQKKEAGVLGLLRAAEARNPLDTRDSAIRSWGFEHYWIIEQDKFNPDHAWAHNYVSVELARAKEINHLVPCQQTATGALRLEAFLLPRKSIKKTLADNLDGVQRNQIKAILEDERGGILVRRP